MSGFSSADRSANPGFDAQGRLVYRAPPRLNFGGPPPTAGRLPQIPPFPDSAALVRFDLATRKLDTVTWFKTPKVNMSVTQSPDGGIRVLPIVNPLPQGDDWAILPDGTIALVRGRDFHVDWVGPQGTTTSPKIPFDWERLSDEAKVALIDSSKIALEKARASGQFNFFGQATARGTGEAVGGAPRDSARRDGAPRDGGSATGAGSPPSRAR